MKFDTKQIISMTEANQNFSRAAKTADELGAAVIFKNNKPRYLLVPITAADLEAAHNQTVDEAAKSVFEKYHAAFAELAK